MNGRYEGFRISGLQERLIEKRALGRHALAAIHDDGNVRSAGMRSQISTKLKASGIRHPVVADDKIGNLFLEAAQSLSHGFGELDTKSLSLKEQAKERPCIIIVIDDKDSGGRSLPRAHATRASWGMHVRRPRAIGAIEHMRYSHALHFQ